MIDEDDIYGFMNDCCVKSKSNVSFTAFVDALTRWINPNRRHEVTLADVFYLMQGQDRFCMDKQGKRVVVLNCAIPDVQRDMVGS